MVIPRLGRSALFGVAVAVSGCSAEGSPTSRPSGARASGAALGPEQWLLLGSGVHEGALVPIEDVLAAPASFVDKDLRIDGAVAAVDPVAGRWLTLGDAGASLRVTFRDEGLSVPVDSRGREAIVEGRLLAKDEVLDGADADAGRRSPSRDTYTFVYVFVAAGVALRRSAAK